MSFVESWSYGLQSSSLLNQTLKHFNFEFSQEARRQASEEGVQKTTQLRKCIQKIGKEHKNLHAAEKYLRKHEIYSSAQGLLKQSLNCTIYEFSTRLDEIRFANVCSE